jgi:hypothetical protein
VTTPFTDPVWLAEVHAWIESHVEVTGDSEQPHVRPWATALRIPTSDGIVWFKASRDAFAYEARLLELLVPLAPDLLPEVIAARPEAGWLLLVDAGERAREHPIDLTPLMRRYAELQITAIPYADAVLAAGAFDTRMPQLDDVFPALEPETAAALRARLPQVERTFARLAESPIPVTLDHGDLHDGNVFSRDGHARLLDWGDAAVGHPLATLALEPDDPAAVDAYLDVWSAVVPRDELLRSLEDVREVRWLLRAINYARVLPYDPTHAEGIELRVGLYFEELAG